MSLQQHILPNGLFVLRKGKEETLATVGVLLPEFLKKLNDRSVVLKCKEMSSRLKCFLREYFLPGTHGLERSIQIIERMHSDNINRAREDGQWMFEFLIFLNSVINNSFTLDGLPSCRSLLIDSAETAARKATDLTKSDIIKGLAHSLFIGKDFHDLVTIADVKQRYQSGLDEFEKEKEGGWVLSLPEQILECKFQIESKYCDMAALHVTGKLTKELYETGKLWIEEQEHKMASNSSILSFSSGTSIDHGLPYSR